MPSQSPSPASATRSLSLDQGNHWPSIAAVVIGLGAVLQVVVIAMVLHTVREMSWYHWAPVSLAVMFSYPALLAMGTMIAGWWYLRRGTRIALFLAALCAVVPIGHLGLPLLTIAYDLHHGVSHAVGGGCSHWSGDVVILGPGLSCAGALLVLLQPRCRVHSTGRRDAN